MLIITYIMPLVSFPLALFPLAARSAGTPPVEFHPVLVQYAEHGTSAAEPAGFPDVINRVPVIVHIHNRLFAVGLGYGFRRVRRCADVLLQVHDMRGRPTQSGHLFRECTEHLQHLGHRRVRKQFATGIDSVMNRDDTHHLDPAQLDERRQLSRPPHGITELGDDDFIAPLQTCHKLFPLRPQCFVFDRFLYHLYTTVLLHPLPVRV